MKKIIYILILVAAAGMLTPAYAQQIVVTGQVTDNENLPVEGALVRENGTAASAVTNSDGMFIIRVAGRESTLNIDKSDYASQEVAVGNSTSLQIVLQEESINIDEIVVVGYGTQSKASVVGSISTTTGSELQKSSQANLTQSLGGRVSGVFSRAGSNRPGEEDASIYIRGLATYNSGANTPLMIVDGVEREISQIDPEDIESFSVLKDASATAVYGVKGANGVIIVTTKRGMTAKPEVTFRSTFTGSTPTFLPKKLGSYDHARLKNEALNNVGQPMEYTSRDLDLFRSGESPYTHPDNNYFDDMLKDVALRQQYNLVVRGGTPFVRYYTSVNFLNDDGIYKTFGNGDYEPNIFFRRYGLRTNLDFNVTKTTVVGVDVSGRLEERHNNGSASNTNGNRLYQEIVRLPADHLNYRNPDGSLGGSNVALVNPYAALSRMGYQHSKRNVFEVVARLNQDLDFLVKGLRARAMFSYVASVRNRRDLKEAPELMYYSREGVYSVVQSESAISIEHNNEDTNGPYTRNVTSELGFDYNFSRNRHKVTALALMNQNQFTNNTKVAELPVAFVNFVGRVTYDYDGRYLGEFNMGYNGSMNFAKGQRFGFFPAVSAGWVASNEKFWKSNKTFSYLKIRGSYGQVGNDRLGDYNYFYQSLYTELGSNRPTFGETQTAINRVYEGKIGNNSVSWERSNKGNIGFDARFLKNRLSLTADAFHEYRFDILSFDESLATVVGMYAASNKDMGIAPRNMGEVVNRGFEVEAGWNDKVGKMNYYLKGNFSFASNKILSDGQAPQTYSWLKTAGYPIGQRYALVCDGFYNSQDEIAALPSGFSSNLKPGDLKYRDVNGDGKTDIYDKVPVGYTRVPEIMYGVTMGLDWNNFDLQLFWQGAARTDVYIDGYGYWEFFNLGTVMEHHLGRWTEATKDTATYPSLSPSRSEQNHRESTFWHHNASYLRLKNAQIGYTIPKHITQKAGISNLRAYIGGTNLLTFSPLKDFDPEMADGTGASYPRMRQYTVGLSVNF